MGKTLGPEHTERGFTIASLRNKDLRVSRLLAAGESPEVSYIRKCVTCEGNLEIRLPEGRSANNLLLRAGWVQSTGAIELYDSNGAKMDMPVDVTNTRSVELVQYPTEKITVAKRLDITLTAPDIHCIRITGSAELNFVLMVGILD